VLKKSAFALTLVAATSSVACKVYPIPEEIVACYGTGATTGAGGTPSVGDAGGSGGAPTGTWVNVTTNLAGLESECGNVSTVAVKPDEDLVLVGVARQGVWGSRDGGESWQRMGTGEGSADIINRPSAFVFDPEDTNRFWESGIYNGPGVYVTRDLGDTFEQLGDVNHTDLVSVDFTDPERKLLLAGGHELPRKLFKSIDGGKTWSDTAQGLPGDLHCTLPHILDTNTYLVGCMAPHGAVLRSEDGGATWIEMEYKGGGGSAPLVARDGSIYWSSPTFGGAGVGLSEDQGLTWKSISGTGFSTPGTPVELPDGRIAILGTDDAVQVTSDKGETWTPITTKLPHLEGDSWLGVDYSKDRNAFFVWRFTCDQGTIPVNEMSIMRYDLEPEAN
jgi:photosystem II stability/assembly factor-like uncharacterized protein